MRDKLLNKYLSDKHIPKKCIIFDFDGTLVLSEEIKQEAYYRLFTNYKTEISEVLDIYREESRFVVIENILKKIKYCDNNKIEVNELAKMYDSIVKEKIVTCPENKGAERLLKQLAGGYKLFLSSITPEESLIEMIKCRKWKVYFSDIFGYPNNKVKTLHKIMKRERYIPRNLIVAGNGESDRFSAEQIGCSFCEVNKNIGFSNLINILEIDFT